MSATKDHLPFGKHNFWICPQCGAVNAYNWADQERAERLLKQPVVICHGSCFDNVCGDCGANIVKPDSPILSPCYTHMED